MTQGKRVKTPRVSIANVAIGGYAAMQTIANLTARRRYSILSVSITSCRTTSNETC